MTDLKLRDCPFCGATPPVHDLDDFLYPVTRPIYSGGEQLWNLNCSENYGGCGASVSGDNEQQCIEFWNRRTYLWQIDQIKQ